MKIEDVYKDWQNGMNMYDLCNKYKTTKYKIKKALDKTPREKVCLHCKKTFVTQANNAYCSERCSRGAYQSAKRKKERDEKKKSQVPKAKKQKVKSIDELLQELKEKNMTFKEYQINETQSLMKAR